MHYDDDISTTRGNWRQEETTIFQYIGVHPIYSEPEAIAIALRPATAAVRFGR